MWTAVQIVSTTLSAKFFKCVENLDMRKAASILLNEAGYTTEMLSLAVHLASHCTSCCLKNIFDQAKAFDRRRSKGTWEILRFIQCTAELEKPCEHTPHGSWKWCFSATVESTQVALNFVVPLFSACRPAVTLSCIFGVHLEIRNGCKLMHVWLVLSFKQKYSTVNGKILADLFQLLPTL